jgi:uncharacterized protein
MRALKTVIETRFKNRGTGFGLRAAYFDETLDLLGNELSWFEVISENYMVPEVLGSTRGTALKSWARLETARKKAPVVFHGVSMNLGSVDALDRKYFKRLKSLASAFEPLWISDHLCFTGTTHKNTHDLLPIPYTAKSLKLLIERVSQAQEILGQRILLENPSTYMAFENAEMSEAQFLQVLSEEADCALLLDINNIYVSSVNHQFDAWKYIETIPFHRVAQIHLAGHSPGKILIDTHDQPVCEAVWALYEKTVKTFGARSTMIERDSNFVDFREVKKELVRVAKSVTNQIQGAPFKKENRTFSETQKHQAL